MKIEKIKVYELPYILTAVGCLILLFVKSLTDIDFSWDSLAYHIQFAARLVGIVGPGEYAFSSWITIIWDSFPKFCELLQGLAWLIVGRPQATNLPNFLSLLFLIWYMKHFYHVPFYLSTLAFLSIPMVQIHATSSYIDLMVNVSATIALFQLYDYLRDPVNYSRKGLYFFICSILFMTASKPQYFLIASLFVGIFLTAFLLRKGQGVFELKRPRHVFGLFLFLFILGLFMSSTLISNFIKFKNPIYPVKISLLGKELPGLWEKRTNPEPKYLADKSDALKWALSMLEFQAFHSRTVPWCTDGGCVPADAPSLRMGGYLGFFVLINIFYFTFLTGRTEILRQGRLLRFIMIGLTLFIPFLPFPENLRYYMHWMMFLVGANLILLNDSKQNEQKDEMSGRVYRWIAFSALIFVISASGGYYLKPFGRTIENHVVGSGIRKELKAIVEENDRICVLKKAPFMFFYAHKFHPELPNYFIQEGWNETDCQGFNKIIK